METNVGAVTAREYRPDIDGLRALAVICVLLFHLDVKGFGGGYVGVDVFFVISGFLITRLIRREVLETKSFSFSRFYSRRARRILPALFVTLALTFLAGVFLLAPDHLERLGGATLHAVMSVSNFYFWGESGYFDTEAVYKPLLHTWSLGVEEQFYLVWPMIVAFLLIKLPKLAAPALLVGTAIVSLALNIVVAGPAIVHPTPILGNLFSDGPSAIFFLAPFRVFEFSLGAIFVWVVELRPKHSAVLEPLVLLGLAMVLYPAVTYTDQIIFPSLNALVPCFGAALVIYAGNAPYFGRLLSNRLAVGIGLISYSLYLVHWPLVVFYRYYNTAELELLDRVMLFTSAILAAILMYRYVEQPFRRLGEDGRMILSGRFGVAFAMIALLITFPAASAWANGGWAWRFSSGNTIELFAHTDTLLIERERWLQEHKTAYFEKWGGTRNILTIGDSYADDLMMALSLNLDERFDVQNLMVPYECFAFLAGSDDNTTQQCKDVLLMLDHGPKIQNADQIFISYRYPVVDVKVTDIDSLLNLLNKHKKQDAKIIILDRGPSFEGLRQNAVAMLAAGQSLDSVEEKAKETSNEWANPRAELMEIAARHTLQLVSKYDIFCSEVRCKYFADSGALMFWDVAHLTVDGAKWFGARVLERIDGQEP